MIFVIYLKFQDRVIMFVEVIDKGDYEISLQYSYFFEGIV